jgi:hypothetical protein
MANGGRPAKAHDLLEPLLAAAPDSYALNLSRTIALARQQRTREALESLQVLRRLGTDPVGLRSAERVVRAELASSAEPGITVYSDSDHLKVQRFAPTATLALASGTKISGGYERTRLEAAAGSGLERHDGTTSADVDQVGVGLAQKLGRLSFGVRLGQATVDASRRLTYSGSVQVRPTDSFLLSAERSEGLFVVSPRTVGIGITTVAHHLEAQWSPGMRYHIVADGLHQRLSDGNERLEITVAPRRAVARRARFNLDLGVTAYRLETTQDLENGYYDPSRYDYYAVTAFPYLKVHENVGVALTISAGAQRDATSPFHFGGTIAGEATFGIYAPWLLKVHGSATMNQRLQSGAFRGIGGGLSLVRRF